MIKGFDRIDCTHPHRQFLYQILSGQTCLNQERYPLIDKQGFSLFLDIPHLFRNGQELLKFIEIHKKALSSWPDKFDEEEPRSIDRALNTLRTLVYTASITAPSDLWLLKNVLSSFKSLGIVSLILQGDIFNVDQVSLEYKFNSVRLFPDFRLLLNRSLLIRRGRRDFQINEERRSVFESIESIPANRPTDWTSAIRATFKTGPDSLVESFLEFCFHERTKKQWFPDLFEIELGYRLLPIIISLRAGNITQKLKEGTCLSDHLSLDPKIQKILFLSGLNTASLRNNIYKLKGYITIKTSHYKYLLVLNEQPACYNTGAVSR